MSRGGFILILLNIVFVAHAQNNASVKQENGSLSSDIFIYQNGQNNTLEGFSEYNIQIADALDELMNPAYQYSENGGINNIFVEQINIIGKNRIILYQSAMENNVANLTQRFGIHTLMLNETSTAGSNETHITQLNGINFANIERSAYLNNNIPSLANTKMVNPSGYDGIYQEGWGNLIIGASEVNIPFIGSTVIPRLDQPAKQISTGGSNWLEIWQTGGANLVGLYQEAGADNTALINQQNGGNTALIFQKNLSGSNYLELEQMGGSSAVIYQSTISGSFNRAIVKQY